jgi:hypothetical protein
VSVGVTLARFGIKKLSIGLKKLAYSYLSKKRES